MTEIKKKKGVIPRKLDDELLLYDKKRAMMHYLNKTASFIWKKINGRRTMEDIAKEIEQYYKIKKTTAMKDVKRVVDNFTRQKLLE